MSDNMGMPEEDVGNALVHKNLYGLTKEQADQAERLIVQGDIGGLNKEQLVYYMRSLCDQLGISWLSKPFDVLVLGGKKVLYANRNCFDQLRATRKISLMIVAREMVNDVFTVTVRAMMPDGRQDESVGAVFVGGLKGPALADALMKAETKAKRRVALSITGASLLDETEIDSIREQTPVYAQSEVKRIEPSAANYVQNPSVFQTAPAVVKENDFEGEVVIPEQNDPVKAARTLAPRPRPLPPVAAPVPKVKL